MKTTEYFHSLGCSKNILFITSKSFLLSTDMQQVVHPSTFTLSKINTNIPIFLFAINSSII
jgi:hypothetical protein